MMRDQVLLNTRSTPGITELCNLGTPHPELAGCKIRVAGTTPVYVIDPEGYRRLVSFPLTFMNLFEDHALLDTLVLSNIDSIAQGPAFDEGSVLLRGRSCEHIYLLDRRKKRPITSQNVMEKYQFSEEAVVVVPKSLIDAIPDGEIWE